ncbi:MAG: hypothetical protein AB8G05_09805 [Oligoflexales bacterium]
MFTLSIQTYQNLILVGSIIAGAKASLAKDIASYSDLFCSQFAEHATKDELILDFPEPTKVTDLVKFVKGHSKIDIAMDRNISGSIQIFAKEKKDIRLKCEEFLAALKNLHLTVVPQNGIYSVMKLRNARISSIPTFYPGEKIPETNQLVRKIIKLRYGNINSLKLTLSRMIQPSQIIAEPASNTFIITESGTVINKLLKMLELFDRPCDSQCRKRIKEMNSNQNNAYEKKNAEKSKQVS